MSNTPGPVVLVEQHDEVMLLTINRPEKRNAYNVAVMDAMADAFREFEASPHQHVAIVTGAGDLAFCSGADLISDMSQRAIPQPYPMTDMFGVGATSKPVIAAINGLAVGGGCEIALASDIRLASDSAWFGLYEPKRGIIPGVAVHLLPRMISYGDAALMLLAAERVTAADALRIGLVQRVVPAADLLNEAFELAHRISRLSQVSLQTIKKLMRFSRDTFLTEALSLGEEMRKLFMLGDDVEEGRQAFAEKREPNFGNSWPRRASDT